MNKFKCESCGANWYSSSDEWTTCDTCGGTLKVVDIRLSEEDE